MGLYEKKANRDSTENDVHVGSILLSQGCRCHLEDERPDVIFRKQSVQAVVQRVASLRRVHDAFCMVNNRERQLLHFWRGCRFEWLPHFVHSQSNVVRQRHLKHLVAIMGTTTETRAFEDCDCVVRKPFLEAFVNSWDGHSHGMFNRRSADEHSEVTYVDRGTFLQSRITNYVEGTSWEFSIDQVKIKCRTVILWDQYHIRVVLFHYQSINH